MKKISLAIVFCIAVLSPEVKAAGIGFGELTLESGYTGSLDTTLQYSFLFNNDFSSTADIMSIAIDGTTAYDHPLTWRFVSSFITGGTSSISTNNINIGGLDTKVVVLDFSGAGRFKPGDWIKSNPWLLPYPVPGAVNVPASDLLGVTVTFSFNDSSTWAGRLENVFPPFISPFPNGIATLQPIPIPAGIWLFCSGLVGLIRVARRKKL